MMTRSPPPRVQQGSKLSARGNIQASVEATRGAAGQKPDGTFKYQLMAGPPSE